MLQSLVMRKTTGSNVLLLLLLHLTQVGLAMWGHIYLVAWAERFLSNKKGCASLRNGASTLRRSLRLHYCPHVCRVLGWQGRVEDRMWRRILLARNHWKKFIQICQTSQMIKKHNCSIPGKCNSLKRITFRWYSETILKFLMGGNDQGHSANILRLFLRCVSSILITFVIRHLSKEVLRIPTLVIWAVLL